MIKVGISGKIAAGKSQIEQIIEKFGFKVFDLDKIAHTLFEDDNIKNLLLSEFKTVDRKEIGKIVFVDIEKKKKLEQIIYPELEKIIFNLFEEYKNEKAVFVSGALLFKSGFYKFFDKTIFIEAKDEIRLERLMKRNNLSFDEAHARLNLQYDGNLADYIIENNDDIELLKDKITKVIEKIVNQ